MQDVCVLEIEKQELPGNTLTRSQRIAAHQGIVFQIVNRLWARLRGIYWIDYDDLAQWAQAGLIHAVDNYRPGVEGREWASFYTYAYHCVHGYALQVFADDSQVTKWSATYRRQMRGNPTSYQALPSPSPTFIPFDFLEHTGTSTDSEAGTLLEFEINSQLNETRTGDPDDSEHVVLCAEAWKSLSQLSPRERKILIDRANEITLEQIGVELGVSRERVRQIERTALNKLRAFLTISGKRRRDQS